MAVIFIAPFNAPTTAVVLPNPQPGDNQASKNAVTVKRAMDGTYYSYVKSNSWVPLKLEFRMQRLKAYEFKGFVQSYHSVDWEYIDFTGANWRVKLRSNPLEIVSQNFDPQNFEWDSIQLSLEGIKL